MPYSLTDAERRSIVRVRTGPDSWGTGFVVGPGLVLTAFHVIGDRRAEGTVFHEGERSLEFVDTTIPGFEVVEGAWDKAADWALLRFDGEVDARPFPLSVVREDDLEWMTYGFPTMQKLDGMLLSGEIENANGELFETRAIQLHCKQMASGQGGLARGASGSPVICGGRVVGILRFTLADAEGQTRGGTLYACPVDLVAGHEGLKVQRDPRRRQRRKIVGGLLAVPALVAAAFAFVPVDEVHVELKLNTRGIGFTVLPGGDGSALTEVAGLRRASLHPLDSVTLRTPGESTVYEDEDALTVRLRAPGDGTAVGFESTFIQGPTGVKLEFNDADPVMTLNPPDSPAARLRAWGRGPIELTIATIGDFARDLRREPALEGATIDLYLSTESNVTLSFGPPGGDSTVVLFENSPVSGLAVDQTIRIRTENVDASFVGGAIEAGSTLTLGRGGDLIELTTNDRLTFDRFSGTIRRLTASRSVFWVDLEGWMTGPRLTSADPDSPRAVEMPSVLGQTWHRWPAWSIVIAAMYGLALLGFLWGDVSRRRRG